MPTRFRSIVALGHRLGRVESLRYLAQSAGSFALNLALIGFCHEILGVAEAMAFAIAVSITFLVNFVVLRVMVFQATAQSAGGQFTRLLLVSLAMRTAEVSAFSALNPRLGETYLMTSALVLVASFCLKFLLYRSFVFAR